MKEIIKDATILIRFNDGKIKSLGRADWIVTTTFEDSSRDNTLWAVIIVDICALMFAFPLICGLLV